VGGDPPTNPVTSSVIARIGGAVLHRGIVLFHEKRQQRLTLFINGCHHWRQKSTRD